MRKLGSWAILSFALSAFACGSDKDDGDGAGGGSGGSINVGTGGGDGSGIPPDNGTGSTPLSPEKLNELRTSACTGWKAEAEPGPAILELVVDVSGSMDATAPGSNQTKWEVTREALEEAVDALPGTTGLGMVLYPNQQTTRGTSPRPVDACVNTDAAIDLAPLGELGSAHRVQIADALDLNPAGGTPTHDAYQFALGAFEGRSFVGNRFMLLITDGQPTFLQGCVGSGLTREPVDEQPIVDEIAGAQADGIRTFIIGSPGSERNESTGDDARPWLSRAAEAGNTSRADCSHDGPAYCHFDMTEESDFGAALKQALATITGQIIDCTYLLPEPPPGQTLNPQYTNVVYLKDGQDTDAHLIYNNLNAECDRGWRLSPDGQSIELCGTTCDSIQTDPGARLELMFGCEAEPVPVR